jgi:hypothetical protein
VTPTKVKRRTLIAGTIIVLAIVAVVLTAAVAVATERAAAVSTNVVPVATQTVTVTSTPAAAMASASVNASEVISGRGTFALDFTLPTFGKSGCLVCHGDKNLIVATGDTTASYWIDEVAYSHGAHAKVACTGCHVDYGYRTPHGQNGNNDWREVAKQACKNCHAAEYADWSLGAHAIRPLGVGQPDPKAASKPLCGDCHGSHYMPVLKNNPAGQAQVQAQAQQMCGKPGCHPDYWANYNDYYHGAAYKSGATDAPACWTCHGTHNILKSTDRLAPTNPANFGGSNSCGTPGCHQGAGPAFASYAALIHGRDKTMSDNPIVKFLTSVFRHG